MAASFDGDHNYSYYKEAFRQACAKAGPNNCAENDPSNRGNQDVSLDGRNAILGWFVEGDPDLSYWFGVQVVNDGKSSRFIDKHRNTNSSGGFYGPGFAPKGCRTDVASGSIFSQFADNDRGGIVFRFNYTAP